MDSVAVLGHEVRNLVATFLGFTELLLEQDLTDAQRRELLETLRDEGLRVNQFLHDLLDLEQFELGSMRPRARPTQLEALLTYAAGLAAHDPFHPIRLEMRADVPLVLAEPDRIQQVLGNLLSNARKYTPAGGEIRVSAEARGKHVVVCVADQGLGIPPEALPRIFSKFYRVQGPGHESI